MKAEMVEHLFTRVRLDGVGSNPFQAPDRGWVLHSWCLCSDEKQALVFWIRDRR